MLSFLFATYKQYIIIYKRDIVVAHFLNDLVEQNINGRLLCLSCTY